MKKFSTLLFLVLFGLFACEKQPLMTRQAFAEIEPGMSIAEVEKKYGKPYQIYSRDGNSDIYEYIERILMGAITIQQWRYYIIVSEGKVVGKYVKFSNPPAYSDIYNNDPYPNY